MKILVSRLVGTHFELANHGAPISVGSDPSTRPATAFSGNTPYVSWREDAAGSVDEGFFGHFVDAADPTLVLDQANVPPAPSAQADVREPISSPCTANPFNADGAACQGGAPGTPFFLSTNAIGSRLALFGNAYGPVPVRDEHRLRTDDQPPADRDRQHGDAVLGHSAAWRQARPCTIGWSSTPTSAPCSVRSDPAGEHAVVARAEPPAFGELEEGTEARVEDRGGVAREAPADRQARNGRDAR